MAAERGNCRPRGPSAFKRLRKFSHRKQIRLRAVRSGGADRRPAGRPQLCLQMAAVWVGALDNPLLARDASCFGGNTEKCEQHSAQVTRIEDDDVIETFAAD